MFRDVGAPHDADRYKWRVFAAIGLSFFTSVTAMSMVFVALPDIASTFDVTLRAVGWVVIVESLVIAATLLPFGRMADVVGRRRIHLVGLAIFGVGAGATALAPSFAILIAARILMAIGNSLGQSVGTAILIAAFPASERGKAVGLQTTSVSIGGISGPILGGLLLQVTSWRVLFVALLVPVVVTLVVGIVVLDEERLGGTDRGSSLDVAGWALSAAAIVVIVVTLNNPFAMAWTSPAILGGGLVGLAVLVGFIRRELSVQAPMLRVSMFADVALASAVSTRMLGFVVTAALQLLLPVYLISLRGIPEGRAAFVMVSASFGLGLSAYLVGRGSDRFGARRFTIAGLAGLMTLAACFAFLDSGSSMVLVVVLVLLNGLAMGAFAVPNSSHILGMVPASDLGVMGAFTNLARTIGTVGGHALATSIVVGVMGSRGFDVPLEEIADSTGASDAFMAGWQVAFLVAACVALAALLLIAASTLVRRDRDGRRFRG
ncbi:MAG: MFS transporter [Actinomycetia bacterium]|nr:MFS transporter [Actinomycetes bacterium]